VDRSEVFCYGSGHDTGSIYLGTPKPHGEFAIIEILVFIIRHLEHIIVHAGSVQIRPLLQQVRVHGRFQFPLGIRETEFSLAGSIYHYKAEKKQNTKLFHDPGIFLSTEKLVQKYGGSIKK
jgi:hypothetical protein